jgi:chaperonin cofactor prefoldin
MNELCEQKHKAIDKTLDEHRGWLEDHDDKIETLQKSDARNTTKLDNLCEQMSKLTKAIWGLVVSILTMMIGFFIWYIQNK